ncbi:MAG: DUF4443 domain-containing protein [Candidatus Thorarchaeota archaeon]
MELLNLLDPTSRAGPPTQFQTWHLLAAFRIFCFANQPIGRYFLGVELSLGGGSIRSLIRFLRNRKLVEPIHRQGHRISAQGKRHCHALNQVLIHLAPVPPSSYTVDVSNIGCHLRGVANYITDGLLQRDAAMQAGATGATTFYQSPDPNILIMPTDHTVPKSNVKEILQPFNLEKGDVLIIGSGSSRVSAQLGALAAAIPLLRKLGE